VAARSGGATLTTKRQAQVGTAAKEAGKATAETTKQAVEKSKAAGRAIASPREPAPMKLNPFALRYRRARAPWKRASIPQPERGAFKFIYAGSIVRRRPDGTQQPLTVLAELRT
jgi:hypothetical protein